VVKSLAVSQSEPGCIYAGIKPAAVYVSRDGGSTWSELDAFQKVRRFFWLSPAERPFSPYVQAIALSNDEPGLVVVGIEAGALVRSTDGGLTWEGHRRGAMRDCHSLVSHASRPGYVYEGGGTGGGAFSRDGGGRWQRPAGLDRKYGWAVAADVTDPELWHLSSSPGVRAHSDHADAGIYRTRGGPWERLTNGLPDPMNAMPYALLTGPLSGVVTAGMSNGELWQSDDAGDSWRRLDVRLPRIERCLARLDNFPG
jgi:hypothetical protein